MQHSIYIPYTTLITVGLDIATILECWLLYSIHVYFPRMFDNSRYSF